MPEMQHWALSVLLPDSSKDRFAMAYEIILAENLNDFLEKNDAEALKKIRTAAAKIFELRKDAKFDVNPDNRLFQIFEFVVLACVGDKVQELQSWFNDNENQWKLPATDERDKKFLQLLYYCWLEICRQRRNETMQAFQEVKQFRDACMQYIEENIQDDYRVVIRLVIFSLLYTITQRVVQFLVRQEPFAVPEADQLFSQIRSSAFAAREIALDILLVRLHVFVRLVLTSNWRFEEGAQ